MLPCTTAAFTSTGIPDDLSLVPRARRSGFAIWMRSALGSRRVCVPSVALAKEGASSSLRVGLLYGSCPSPSAKATGGHVGSQLSHSLYPCWLCGFASLFVGAPRLAVFPASVTLHELASGGSLFISMFWYSYRGLEPRLQRAHAGHTQVVADQRPARRDSKLPRTLERVS